MKLQPKIFRGRFPDCSKGHGERKARKVETFSAFTFKSPERKVFTFEACTFQVEELSAYFGNGLYIQMSTLIS
ncbi:MAG: hypothetical protein AAGG68_06840 [Bacteroidota bacterium]